MPLTPIEQKFILHWGEMGTRWGINRTVAQIHALLFVSPKPLHAEEIAETLSVARSNVSTSLKELQGWGIIRVVHVMDETKLRESDQTLTMVPDCLLCEERNGPEDKCAKARLAELLSFFGTV